MILQSGQNKVKKILIGLSAVYVAVFLFMLIFRPGSESFYAAFFNLYQAIPPAFAGVCGLLTARAGTSLPPARRWGWFFVGLGCLSFATGQSIWFYWESIRGVEVPFPGWSDVGYVGTYPFLFTGVLLLINSYKAVGRTRNLIDCAIAASSFGMLSWTFIIGKQWAQTELDLLGRLVTVAYPLGDIAVIFAAIVAVTSTADSGAMKRAIKMIGAGMVLVTFSDTVFTLMTLNETYKTGSWADWGWSFGWLTIGWACLSVLWNLGRESTVEPKATRFNKAADAMRLYGPYVAVFASIAIIFGHDFVTTGKLNLSAHGEVLALLFLIILRQVFMVIENAKLSQEVRRVNDNLATLVSDRTHQLESLQELTKAVSSTLEIKEVVATALQHAKGVFGSNGVALWIKFDQFEGDLELAGADGLPADSQVLHQLANMEFDGPSLAMSLEECDGTTAHCVVARLVWQGETLGRVALSNNDKPFAEEHRRMVESLGLVIGTAVQNATHHANVAAQADRDSVTGLFNHRAFHSHLDRALRRSSKEGTVLSIMEMDLDNFKLFNDTYGHVCGDEVLKTVASVMKDNAPENAILARFGGDEFVLVIPGADEETSAVIAGQIACGLEAKGYSSQNDDRRIPIGVSIGIAVHPQDGTNRHELLTVADRNLYEAKNNEEKIVYTSATQRENHALKTYESFATLDALITAVDNKDRYTRKHSEDVTEYALWIAEEIGLSEETMRSLRMSGLLHDVGKIGVPDEILRKPGRLTPEEYEIMQRHPRLGELIVGAIPGMEAVVDGVRAHHERWDGAGYPDQLAANDIPLFGRILAVADAFSAMTTDRPYRKGMDWPTALEIVQTGAGSQFDPEMSQAFLKAVRKRGLDKTAAQIAA